MKYIKVFTGLLLFIIGLAFIDKWVNAISLRCLDRRIEQMRQEGEEQRIVQERLVRNLVLIRPPSYRYPSLYCKYNVSSNIVIRV